MESIRVNTRSGPITVFCEERDDIAVESGADRRDLRREGAQVNIEPAGRLVLRCPAGLGLFLGSLSGRIEVHGRAGDTRINTASGAIAVSECRRADLRSLSGLITVGHCGAVRAATKSGRIEVDEAGRAHLATVSGGISAARVTGEARVKTVSGRVQLGAKGRDDIDIHTISGSVTVTVPEGTRPRARLKSLAGRPRCDCPPGEDCSIAVSSLSGKIEVVAD